MIITVTICEYANQSGFSKTLFVMSDLGIWQVARKIAFCSKPVLLCAPKMYRFKRKVLTKKSLMVAKVTIYDDITDQPAYEEPAWHEGF